MAPCKSLCAGLCDLMPCSQTASCAFAPSPTTQSATVTARPRSTRLSPPASQPAESPQSISPCARGAYHCGSLGQYTVERLVYDTVSRSTSCDASAGRGVCLIATGPLDLNIYGSIKSGTCKSVSPHPTSELIKFSTVLRVTCKTVQILSFMLSRQCHT